MTLDRARGNDVERHICAIAVTRPIDLWPYILMTAQGMCGGVWGSLAGRGDETKRSG